MSDRNRSVDLVWIATWGKLPACRRGMKTRCFLGRRDKLEAYPTVRMTSWNVIPRCRGRKSAQTERAGQQFGQAYEFRWRIDRVVHVVEQDKQLRIEFDEELTTRTAGHRDAGE